MGLGVTRSSRRQARCTHESIVEVRSQRVERRICEDCAYVSFSIVEEELANGRREKSSRETDQLLELVGG